MGAIAAPPRIIAVTADSPAALAGVEVGDVVASVNGEVPRDVIRYQILVEGESPRLELVRGDETVELVADKAEGVPLGIEVQSPLFDQVQTCDNHCPFCFIYQLPKGMRRCLYLKDDDYRLSFLYGNFTTLTRFTELDLERVVTEGLSPLFVSIHATDPTLRTELLRNRRGATSLRWMRALLDHEIEVHGQIVVCPGINDGPALVDTLRTIADEYPELASVAVVPLGISDHSNEPTMRAHTRPEAEAVLDTVQQWQERFNALVGHRMVHAADEYYLLAQRPFPPAADYEGFDMYEDGIGMARSFIEEFTGRSDATSSPSAGFFAAFDAAPAVGYRTPTTVTLQPRRIRGAQIGILTGPLGANVIEPLVADRPDVRVLAVPNNVFGGNIGVTGLMCGSDVAAVLSNQPATDRYLLPDVCLSADRFLDDWTVDDLPVPVEVVPTNGAALAAALGTESP